MGFNLVKGRGSLRSLAKGFMLAAQRQKAAIKAPCAKVTEPFNLIVVWFAFEHSLGQKERHRVLVPAV